MICRNCGTMVTADKGHIIDGEFYCNDCTVKCDDCGDYTLANNSYTTADGNTML